MPNTTGAVILPFPAGTDARDVRGAIQALATAVASQVPAYLVGTRTANPAGTARRLLVEGSTLYWDNGTAWLPAVDLSAYATSAAVASALAGKLGASAKAADSDLLDGIDSTTFARRDQANNLAGTLNITSGQLQEGGQRVYSPNNPPPMTGIANKYSGQVTVPFNSTGTTYSADVTIPAVNMTKSQVRLLGVTGRGNFSGSITPAPGLALVGSTTLRAYVTASAGSATIDPGAYFVVSYEITEWS